MSALETAGFYNVMTAPSDPEVAELRRVLKDVVQAALYYRGPLYDKRLEDTLLNIGRAVDELFT
jgi:hypothetical protein